MGVAHFVLRKGLGNVQIRGLTAEQATGRETDKVMAGTCFGLLGANVSISYQALSVEYNCESILVKNRAVLHSIEIFS